MAEFDAKELSQLIHLCRIECTDDEKQNLHAQITEVLSYIEQLNAVDVHGVEPCYRVSPALSNVMREDTVGELLSREEFLANAPAHVGGMIRVPPVIKFSNS